MNSPATIDPHRFYLQELGDWWDVVNLPIGDGWRRNPLGCPFCDRTMFFFNTTTGAFVCTQCDAWGESIADFKAIRERREPETAV